MQTELSRELMLEVFASNGSGHAYDQSEQESEEASFNDSIMVRNNSGELELMQDGFFQLELIRQPVHLLVIYCIAYGVVFLLGFVGNVFVVAAVIRNKTMHNITNFFITSLATADLLIIIFCLPATLMNNILTEWLLGNFLCKLSVWLNGTTVCASVYTLVAVSADRYFALCHTMRYSTLERRKTFFIIIPIWIVACVLFSPWLVFFEEVHYPINDNNETFARICIPNFPDVRSESLFFLIVNFLIAFIIPLIAIIFCYAYIFAMVFNRQTIAVDRKATERDQRTRMKVTNMMVTVVATFAFNWLPLYLLFTYIYFGQPDLGGSEGEILMNILKPIFQWMSLANSCINPLLYAYFSAKFRKEFLMLIVLPCRRNFDSMRRVTRATMKRVGTPNKKKQASKTGSTGSTLITETMACIPEEDAEEIEPEESTDDSTFHHRSYARSCSIASPNVNSANSPMPLLKGNQRRHTSCAAAGPLGLLTPAATKKFLLSSFLIDVEAAPQCESTLVEEEEEVLEKPKEVPKEAGYEHSNGTLPTKESQTGSFTLTSSSGDDRSPTTGEKSINSLASSVLSDAWTMQRHVTFCDDSCLTLNGSANQESARRDAKLLRFDSYDQQREPPIGNTLYVQTMSGTVIVITDFQCVSSV